MKWLGGAPVFLLIAALAGCLDDGPPAVALQAGPDLDCLGGCNVSFRSPAAPAGGWLEVLVSWDGTRTADVNGTLTTPEGDVLDLERGFDSRRALVFGAQEGAYTLDLVGDGPFEVTSRLLPLREGPVMLPNVVTMVPKQVAFGPCDTVERNEQGAERCLRLGNAIGNTGAGPLEVRLSFPNAALTIAGKAVDLIGGDFLQRIHQRDGSVEEENVGNGDFHVSHAHFHYDGFAAFELFPVDEDGLRGALAATGHKSGFCFLDWGEMEETDAPDPQAGTRAEQDCLVPSANGITMGITSGWFDFYWAGLTDQYVEASGVADGLYELVSTGDPEDVLAEEAEHDNAASVLIRITGNQVEVLEERGYYHIPPGTNNL